jgi:hypothetical protein
LDQAQERTLSRKREAAPRHPARITSDDFSLAASVTLSGDHWAAALRERPGIFAACSEFSGRKLPSATGLGKLLRHLWLGENSQVCRISDIP